MKFPIGCLVHEQGNTHLSASNPSVLARKFATNFKQLFMSTYYRALKADHLKSFIRSQSSLSNIIRRIVDRQTSFYFYSLNDFKSRQRYLVDWSMATAGNDFFNPMFQRTSATRISARLYFEEFLISNNFHGEIILEGSQLGVVDPYTKDFFKIPINLNYFIGTEVRNWGLQRSTSFSAYNLLEAKKDYISAEFKNTKNLLEEIIHQFGNDKVRIFPVVNSKNWDYGIQYLEQGSNPIYDHGMQWAPRPTGAHWSSFWEIDLSNKERSNLILDHIINLMLTGKVSFIMKGENGEIGDHNMICGFNFNGFFGADEIFSRHISDKSERRYVTNGFYMREINIYNTPRNFDLRYYKSRWNKTWGTKMVFWSIDSFNKYLNMYI